MGAKQSHPVSKLYRKRTDVTAEVMAKTMTSDSEREWVKLNARRGSLLWVMQKETRQEAELKTQTKAQDINVQKATKRRRHISFPESSEKLTHRATLSTFDSSKTLLPVGTSRYRNEPKPFISTTHLLKRQAEALSSPKQSMQFEDTSLSTAVLCTDFRRKAPESAKSQYKLIRPKPQLEDFSGHVDNYPRIETDPGAPSMMSILREATEIRYQPAASLVARRNIVDLRAALSPAIPSGQKSAISAVGLKAQFDVFSFSSEAEKQMGQYRIKTQAQPTTSKVPTTSPPPKVHSRSDRHWAWRGKNSNLLHPSS